MGESATIRVSRRAQELRSAGIEVLDLSAGEPDFPSPACALEGAETALRRGLTRYTVSAGPQDLRETLAERYREDWNAPWSSREVLITVGGKGALFELALALFDEGREVVVPAPAWVSFAEQIRLAGAEPVMVPMDAEGGFELEAQPLLAALTERTVAVILNSPCNPTGAVISEKELSRLIEGCAERGVLVVSDETYERFVYEGHQHWSAARWARDFPETIVVVGSFSKTWAMTGWRVGWALGPRELIDAMASIQSHAVTHPTTFAMAGALAALRGAEREVEVMLDAYGRRRRLVLERLRSMPGVEIVPPAGSFYAFPEIGALLGPDCPDSVALAEWLLEKGPIAVVPGAAFGSDRHLRLSFACADALLERALDRLGELFSERASGVAEVRE